jgi:iron-sulfur cluster repair protein YtfE (RIC family)
MKNTKVSQERGPGEQEHKTDTPTCFLHDDHEKVKELFSRCEKAPQGENKMQMFEAVARELKAHSAVEKEIFYPLVWENTNADEQVKRAAEEHRVMDTLLEELEEIAHTRGSTADFCAKFTQLRESMAEHIKADETALFPKVEKAGIDNAAVARSMRKRRKAVLHEKN